MNRNKVHLLMFAMALLPLGGCGHSTSSSAAAPSPGGGENSPVTCPTGFVLVPRNVDYVSKDFCMMKYEARDAGNGTLTSTPLGAPILNINRSTAAQKCQALGAGYALPTNEQWQTLVRNIAGEGENWSSGTVGNGELNRGNTDGSGPSAQAASADDVNGNCINTTTPSCSSTVWDSQRRTHVLSNDSLIWDVGGNLVEWVSNTNTVAYSPDNYASSLSGGDEKQFKYGPHSNTLCAAPGTTPWCGMGIAYLNSAAGGIVRGGDYNHVLRSGIFAASLYTNPDQGGMNVGFRCVYNP